MHWLNQLRKINESYWFNINFSGYIKKWNLIEVQHAMILNNSYNWTSEWTFPQTYINLMIDLILNSQELKSCVSIGIDAFSSFIKIQLYYLQ